MNILKLVSFLYNFTRKLIISCLIIIKIFSNTVTSQARTQIKANPHRSQLPLTRETGNG